MTYISKCCDYEATLDEASGEYICKLCHEPCSIYEEETEPDDQEPPEGTFPHEKITD